MSVIIICNSLNNIQLHLLHVSNNNIHIAIQVCSRHLAVRTLSIRTVSLNNAKTGNHKAHLARSDSVENQIIFKQDRGKSM